jgi:hypothetical protein
MHAISLLSRRRVGTLLLGIEPEEICCTHVDPRKGGGEVSVAGRVEGLDAARLY